MRNFILLVGAVIALTGCANRRYPSPPPQALLKFEDFGDTIPRIGTTAWVEVGATMYEDIVAKMDQKQELTLGADASGTTFEGDKFFMAKGAQGLSVSVYDFRYPSYCPKNATTEKYGPVCLVDQDSNGIFEGALNIVNRRWAKLDAPTPYAMRALPFERSKSYSRPDARFSGKKRELLYQGLSKGTVKVSYREFIDNLARPAFTQDILYDLKTDGTGEIAFNGLRIKILEASNSQIVYILEAPILGSPASLYPVPKN